MLSSDPAIINLEIYETPYWELMLTAIVVGVTAKYILDVSWLKGMLFGSIVGSTAAAATFAILASKPISKKMTSLLEARSGLNAPMAIFLTISMIQLL